jgi:hypothetical protein
VPQTEQCPEIAGAELPHWGQFIIGLFWSQSDYRPNRGIQANFDESALLGGVPVRNQTPLPIEWEPNSRDRY